MAISFNTAASANGAGVSETSQNLTIPAGVLAGDVMLLVINGFSNGASGSVTVSASSTGTAFTQIGSQQVGGAGASGFNTFGAIFDAVASSTDAGKVITATINNPGGSNFIAMSMAAYTGASNTAPIDVSGGTNSATSPLTFPAETTTVAGDWAIYLSAFGESTNATFTGPSGTSTRTTTESGGVGSGIWDSNASVGGAGTGIGGASFQFSSTSTTVWLTGFTIGLSPPVAAAVTLSAAPGRSWERRFKHRQAYPAFPPVAAPPGSGPVPPAYRPQRVAVVPFIARGGTY